MDSIDISPAKRRILADLKRQGGATATELAERLALTDVAVRQHLQGLEQRTLVDSSPLPAKGRGRPGAKWTLTSAGHSLFPERHADLTVQLIEGTRKIFGQAGLDQIVRFRAKEQVAEYKQKLPAKTASLKKRVEALAELRTEEGYMAEVIVEKPGSYLLIENHCPICDAAKACLGFCTAELDVFRRALGKGVHVERTKHLLSGDQRCVYRIR